MKAYETYKNSGYDWYGEVPINWQVKDLKFVMKFHTGGTPSTKERKFYEGDLTWVSIGDLEGKFVEQSQSTLNKDGVKSANIPLTPKGSLMYSFKLSVGLVAFANKDLYTNEAIASFLPTKGLDLDFWYYALPFSVIHNANENIYGAKLLNQELIKNAAMIVPPLPEQRQIAAYLDYKTEQIDRFIANRKKQIELLEEQKEAIIKKAVTKGINSAVRLKESNVEYVGRIPEHWEVAKLKHVATVKGRIGYRGYTTADLVDEGNGALTLGATQFDKYGRVDLNKKVFISWDKYYESPEIMIDKGDLIVVQRGSTSGKVGIIDQDISTATINPSIVLIKKIRINRYFLFYYLRAISDEFSYLNVSQTAIPMLSQNQIENIPLLVVPKDEQEQILLYIETELKERDEIITKFQQQIDMMLEYKTSLISKAVTGKIDVREWQPKHTLKETV